jgi:transcriptional regulator with XRE-family HTH domain
MPKRRPMEFLRRLGARMRARRLYLGRTQVVVASGVEISVTQLALYESGQGHPPAATLHRIAVMLGTSSSSLLGETMSDNAEVVDEMMKIHSHPVVASVLRHMQDMTMDDCKSLVVVAAAFASRNKVLDKVEVMR